jgi:acid phosphatase family membrane protein YuiD
MIRNAPKKIYGPTMMIVIVIVIVIAALCPSPFLLTHPIGPADALVLAPHRRNSFSRAPYGGAWGGKSKTSIASPPAIAAASSPPPFSLRPFDVGSSSHPSPTRSTSSMTSSSESSSHDNNNDIMRDITTVVGGTASLFVSFAFLVLLAYYRDANILSVWIGSILNAICGKFIKRLLKHDRPFELRNNDRLIIKPSDGGMPSSHAMSLGFIGTSILLCGIVPIGHRAVLGSIISAYTAIALRYRIREKLHTLPQVIVGLALGVSNALSWLAFGMGAWSGGGGGGRGPVVSYVERHWTSSESGLFPYYGLVVPVIVGILVVGSFERRLSSRMMVGREKRDMKEG